MAEQKSFPFVLSDDSVNRYGYRVLTEGINLDNFVKNPVALWLHTRDTYEFGRDRLPIGRWENVRKEKGKLVGDLVFDETDKFAQKLQSKVEQKILSAISIGFSSIATSDDPELVVKGQRGPTIVGCELLEASLVDIPANANAIKLYNSEGIHTLSLEMLENFNLNKNSDTNQKPNSMKIKLLSAWAFILGLLGLEAGKDHEVELTSEQLATINSSGEALNARINDLEARLAKATTERDNLQEELATANTELTTLRKAPGAQTAAAKPEPKSPEAEPKELSATTEEALKLFRPKK